MLLLLVAPTLSLLLTANTAPTMTLSRRAAIGGLVLTPAAVFAVDLSDADLQCEDGDDDCLDKKQAAIKEKIKQRAKVSAKKRIEESKKGPVRKPTDLVENRRTTVDYSCVVATGSPCPTSEEAN